MMTQNKILTSLFIIGFLTSSLCFADLKVYPTRVLFSGRDHSASVNLRHVGSKKTNYRIDLIFYDVDETGKYVEIPNPSLENHHFIGPILRYSPRQVVLEPGVEQVIRLMVRPNQDIADGEYRAHIRFSTYEDEDAVDLFKGEANKDGIAMAIRAQKAVAIPVVYRKGDLTASLKMGVLETRLVNNQMLFKTVFEKNGLRSIYGDANIFLKEGEQSIKIGTINGLSVYKDKQVVELPANLYEASKLTQGNIELEFQEENSKLKTTVEFKIQGAIK